MKLPRYELVFWVGVVLMAVTPWAWPASVTVDTLSGIVDGNTMSIAALQADRGSDGAISLREAILAANTTTGADTILFSVSGTLAGMFPLPPLVDSSGGTTINGGGQIRLDGGFLEAPADGLVIHSSNNVIRGLTITQFEGFGIVLEGLGVTGNGIFGCQIGTDGLQALGNSFGGIGVFNGALSNQIGGILPGEGNVISGNTGCGVQLLGEGTENNAVLGNLIGTSASGNAAIPNTNCGVSLENGASNNMIGGPGPGRNIISGNTGAGVLTVGLGTASNTIRGNTIGLGLDGSTALGNGGHGVSVVGEAEGTLVGGAAPGEGNTISGNQGHGIYLGTSSLLGNIVRGNLIGTDAAGAVARANQLNGVHIENSPGNTLGGGDPDAGNVICGNMAAGIGIMGLSSTGNVVQGNLIGLLSNNSSLPNNTGVMITDGAKSNIVGGGGPDTRNVVSGNEGAGILLFGMGTSANTVSGNFIGTDSQGGEPRGNSNGGIQLLTGAAQNQIGGMFPGEGNVISGNVGPGIAIEGSAANGNLLAGNLIGLNANGAEVLGNAGAGIQISGPSINTAIGGTEEGAGNTICANAQGIALRLGCSGTIIRGNYIGTNRGRVLELGNAGNGVEISDGAFDNLIGGGGDSAGNVIAYNLQNGVSVSGKDTKSNPIRRNAIFRNVLRGIRLTDNGNELLDAPVITEFGSVHGTAAPGSLVDLFIDSEDEGEFYLDSVLANTNGDFSSTADLGPFEGRRVTATATDGARNSSEFSEARLIDLTPPSLTLLGTPSIAVECGAVFVDPGATAADNIDGDISDQIVVSGDAVQTGAPGTYQILYDVMDSSGNAGEQLSREVVVADTTAPSISLVGADVLVVECQGVLLDPGVTTSDVCDLGVGADVSSNVVLSAPGDYEISYSATDASGNQSAILTRSVIVQDSVAPSVTLLGGVDVTVNCGGEFIDPGAMADDLCDAGVLAVVSGSVDTGTPGDYVLTYSATDADGNAAPSRERAVSVVDTAPPLLSLLGDNPLFIPVGSAYVEAGAAAFDECDGDLTGIVEISGEGVNTDVPGTYQVNYSVVDATGNFRIVERTVQVTGPQPPMIGVSPESIEFGTVVVGGFIEAEFRVRNSGEGVLSGEAEVSPPFSISGSAAYEMGAGETALVKVRFAPSTAGSFEDIVFFSGGGNTEVFVLGTALAGAGTISGVVGDIVGALPCAAVVLTGPPGPNMHGSTSVVTVDVNGRYEANTLEPGTYSVTAYAPGYAPVSVDAIVESGLTTVVDFQMAVPSEAGVITGMITDETTGAFLSGVEVLLYSGTTLVGLSFTCEDGVYEIMPDLAGVTRKQVLTLEFNADNYDFVRQDIIYVPGETVQYSAVLASNVALPGILDVRVNNANTTAPIADARVVVKERSTGISDRTNASGQVTFPTLFPGSYTVTVSSSGFGTFDGRVSVYSGTPPAALDVSLLADGEAPPPPPPPSGCRLFGGKAQPLGKVKHEGDLVVLSVLLVSLAAGARKRRRY